MVHGPVSLFLNYFIERRISNYYVSKVVIKESVILISYIKQHLSSNLSIIKAQDISESC